MVSEYVLGGRKGARVDFSGIGFNGCGCICGQMGIAFDEFRFEGVEQTQHVINHKDLAVAPC